MSAATKVAVAAMLTRRDLCARLGIARATSYRLEKSGHLPRPVRIAPRVVRWLACEVEAFGARRLDHPQPV